MKDSFFKTPNSSNINESRAWRGSLGAARRTWSAVPNEPALQRPARKTARRIVSVLPVPGAC